MSHDIVLLWVTAKTFESHCLRTWKSTRNKQGVDQSALYKKFAPKKNGEEKVKERAKQGVIYDQRSEKFPW